MKTVSEEEIGKPHKDSHTQSSRLEGKTYADRKSEQEILERAFAQLKYFNGDGQIRFNGIYNGSIFLFNETILMTNKHVVIGKTINDIEYIDFPQFAFINKNQESSIKSYLKMRLERGNTVISDGQKILKNRIANLEDFTKRSEFLDQILRAYVADLKLLENHAPRKFEDKIFFSTDEIKEIFYRIDDVPDIALIILKRPINLLFPEQGSTIKINENDFAENTLYHPTKHGWMYAGVPIYIAGFGRGIDENSVDKNKSIKSFRSDILVQANNKIYYTVFDLVYWSQYDKEFYIYEKGSNAGDSGSRIFAYLDSSGKIARVPASLDAQQVTLGLNATDINGVLFSKKTLEPFRAKLNLPTSSFPELNAQQSSSLDYLLSFTPKANKDFIEAIIYYALYKSNTAALLHDFEEHYLWSIIAYKLQNLLRDIAFDQFEISIAIAAANYFSKAPLLSPAELDRAAWNKLLVNSDIFSEAQKNTLNMIINGTLFKKFIPDFEVKLTNIIAPVNTEKYLLALEAWVNSKKHRRQENYAYDGISVPNSLKKFSSIDDFLTQEKLR